MNKKYLKILNVISFIVLIGINALAELLPIGGKTTGEISKQYPSLFTPAPITFSVWGVIYLLLLMFILYGCGVFGNKKPADEVFSVIGVLFSVSCLFNVGWLLLWHFDFIGLSVLAIIGLLVTLVFTEKRLKGLRGNTLSFISVNAPFDIYYGWIITATISNISVFLVKIGWNGFGLSESFWTSLVLIIGAVITFLVVVTDNKRLSGFTVIWGYIGILISHFTKYGGKYTAVIVFAFLGIGIMLISILTVTIKKKFLFEQS